MNRSLLGMLDGATLIDRLTGDVDDTAKRSWPYGNQYGGSSISGLPPSYKTFGTCALRSVLVGHKI